MSGKSEYLKQLIDNASRSEQQQCVSAVQSCPNKNWVELVYKYNSNRAVSGAAFEVFDAATNQSLKKGVLDPMGYAKVPGLPDNVKNVYFTFYDDPKPFEIFDKYKPKPHNLTPEVKEIKEEDGTVMSVLKWIGTALAGDFAEDQSFGQIAFGTVVTLIPVVDQVGDVRDIVANLHKLIWKGKHKDFGTWFSLVVTIIGCVPEVGSVVKGIAKAVYKLVQRTAKKLPLTRLIRMLNSVGEGNVIRFLRMMADKLTAWGEKAGETIVRLLENLRGKLQAARKWAFSKAEELLDLALKRFDELIKLAPEMAKQVAEYLVGHLKKALKDVGNFVMKGVTRARNGAKQLEEKFLRLTGLELRKLAKSAGMKPEQIEKLAEHCQKTGRMTVIRFTNPDSLKYQGKKHWFNGFEKDYLPKPLPVKLKTAKDGDYAGLVTYPRKPKDWDAKNPGKEWKMEKWEEDNIADLKKEGYFFDQNGLLHDKHGNAFHGDYDVQSVHRRVEMENPDGTKGEVYLNELSNPEDKVSTIEDMNRSVMGDIPEEKRVFQHGAEGDYRVRVDENGDIATKGHKPIPVSSDEMNAGGKGGKQMQAGKDYKLGREHGDDEKYLVVDADGNYKVIDSPKKLKELYDNAGLPWEYSSTFASAPANAMAAGAGK
ncbi:MAG TPA: hypothetical protein VIL74_13175 [Pyrinomonadaceae bacterium]|jgi:hypothetical protein